VAEFAVARNVADVAPEATVTLGGTVTAALLLASVITVFPEAGALRFTVQFDVAPLATLDGLQFKVVSCAGATDTVAWTVPFKEAVMVAV
jgi:hypothetical protein